MTCTCIQQPVECVPNDGLTTVVLCDNTLGSGSMTCNYVQEVGTLYGETEETSMLVSDQVEEAIQTRLADLFQDELGDSPSTGYDWRTAPAQVFESSLLSAVAEVVTPPGETYAVEQVIGFCGDNVSRTQDFQVYSIDKDGRRVAGSERRIVVGEGMGPRNVHRRNQGNGVGGREGEEVSKRK